MFEQSTTTSYSKFNLKKTDETSESNTEESQRKISPKPVLPIKPLTRPTLKSNFSPEPIIESQTENQPNKFFKLKPINIAKAEQSSMDAAESKTSTSSEDLSKSVITTTSPLLSSSSAEVLNIKDASSSSDKRSSVKDIIQMLSDESKA